MILLLLFSILAQVPTPTPGVDVGGYVATAQALTQELPITTDGEQIYDTKGSPLLPDVRSSTFITAIGYIKYALSGTGASALFGPFAPISLAFRNALFLAFLWFAFYWIFRMAVFMIKFGIFAIRTIGDMWDTVPFA